MHLDDQQRPSIQEINTGRLYAVTPWTPDQEAWWDANIRQRKQSVDQQNVVFPPGGYLCGGSVNYPTGFTLVEAYFGVAALQQALGTQFRIWPGLSNGTWILQNVISFGDPSLGGGFTLLNGWQLWDEAYSQTYGDHRGVNAVLLPPGTGVWGTIRYYGGPKQWIIRTFKGNPGNTGPAWGRPLTGGLTINAQTDFSGSAYPTPSNAFKQALTAIEPIGSIGACGQISVTAVWGGLFAYRGANAVPVNWAGYQASVACPITVSVSNPTLQGHAQVTSQIFAS